MDKVCEFCGETFVMRSARSRFCSPGCNNKNYYHTNPEYRQAQKNNSRKRLAENPEAMAVVLAAGKRWRESHRDEARAASRRWYRNNKERCAENSKRWWRENPEKQKEYRDSWKAENPERTKEFWKDNTYRRRALKAQAEGSFAYEEFVGLCNDLGWVCFYCGCDLDSETATADHMVPLSRGGANGIENIAPACQSCNSKKHDKTVEEFIATSPVKEVHY